MPEIQWPGRRRFIPLCILLMLGLGMTALLYVIWTLPGIAAGLDYFTYVPLVAKPVPTPTATPTVTPTPLPPNVRVEPSCSNFRGGTAQDPTGEYVCFKSYDSRPINMTGWKVQDSKRQEQYTYTFPPFILSPGATVKLHSGYGQNTTTDLYWCRGGLIWNNDHDIVYLFDASWREIHRYTY
ncbi:MAG: lamin tail domain-containing protein [Anaerolineae bacterium]